MFFQMTMSVTLGVFIYEGTAYNLLLGLCIQTSFCLAEDVSWPSLTFGGQGA